MGWGKGPAQFVCLSARTSSMPPGPEGLGAKHLQAGQVLQRLSSLEGVDPMTHIPGWLAQEDSFVGWPCSSMIG